MILVLPPHVSSEEALLACRLSAWQGIANRCRWCDKELEGRRRRWCSDECANEFGYNHWWTAARSKRLRIDENTCQHCGVKSGSLNNEGLFDRVVMQVHHKVPLHTLSLIVKVHWRGDALIERKVTHSDGGCWHHVEGLVTLCHDCHQLEHHPPAPPDPQMELQ